MTTEPLNTELSVRTESIQSLYTRYRAHRFNVNRRYQRKLVWSVEEKWSLIDSILLSMPIPLFLVAETGIGADASFEVIDGMQRLNAMFSFLENEFPVQGSYFDLDALADTKSLKDQGSLEQKQPVLSRAASVAYSNYTVALSVYRSHDGAHVDEVFRRINSGGKLSHSRSCGRLERYRRWLTLCGLSRRGFAGILHRRTSFRWVRCPSLVSQIAICSMA